MFHIDRNMIGQNLKALRKRKGQSQEEVAVAVGTNRSTYSGYENGVASPGIEGLVSFGTYYDVSIDALLKTDFASFKEQDWVQFESAWKREAKGTTLRVLTALVDNENCEVIEMIPQKARAGYTSGYADISFFKDLPTMQLPFLSKERKYRAFQIEGDSMLPVPSGSYIVGGFVQDWTSIKSGTACIVLTKNDGIVFKIVFNELSENKCLLLVSSNPVYEPFQVKIEDVLEIWKFETLISKDLPEGGMESEDLVQGIKNIQKDVRVILNKLSKA